MISYFGFNLRKKNDAGIRSVYLFLFINKTWTLIGKEKNSAHYRCAGHEILMPRETRPVGLVSPPRLVPQLIFLNINRARPNPPAYARKFFNPSSNLF